MKIPGKRMLFLIIFLALLGAAAFHLNKILPVATGNAAKNMCSCLFVAGRDEASVKAEDLGFFPVSLVSCRVNYEGKSVTARIFGLAFQKAVFREGSGCTLIADHEESEVRALQFEPQEALPERPDTLFWPVGDLLPDSMPDGVDTAALHRAIDSAFATANKTRAVVVVYKGLLIAERYAEGFDKDTRQLGWSMAKSVTSSLVGILINQGKLSLEQTFPFEEWQGDGRKAITLNDLLRMSSGLSWWEFYFYLSPATRMLYKKGDMGRYVMEQPLEAAPGEHWEYASGTSNLVQYIIRRTMDDQKAYMAFPRRELFNRIGMRSAVLEMDASGTFVGSSYLWATPRDWARFGLLYLQDGVWNGERILPEGWVDYSRMPAPASGGLYGAHFWLKDPVKFPDAPDDLYACQGFQGQRVFIIPSHDLVIVRMGLADERVMDFNGLVSSVAVAVGGGGGQ